MMETESKGLILCKLEDLYFGDSKPVMCFTCLSTERKLFAVKQYSDILVKVCDISDIDSKNVCLCWECIALLRKVAIFKEKFYNAQKILAETEFVPRCLSTLAKEDIDIENIEKVIYCEEKIVLLNPKEELLLEFDQKDEKPVIIKEEFELHIDKTDNESYYMEDLPIDENAFIDTNIEEQNLESKDFDDIDLKAFIKKINKPRKKTNPKFVKRSKPYQIMPENVQTRDFIVKEKINPDDLNGWLEEERNSRYFRTLPSKCDKCVCEIDVNSDHEMMHDKSIGPYNCVICETYFANEDSFAKHVLDHYFVYRCVICDFRCYSKCQMDHHLSFHNKRVHCLECGAGFKTVREFYMHHKELHSVCICHFCNKKASCKEKLLKHMRHHNEHKCEICNVSFKTYKNYMGHMQGKHEATAGEDAFCVKCNKQFANSTLFKRHIANSLAHADERRTTRKRNKKVPCPVCGNVYARHDNMMNHYRLVHLKESKYHCVDCNKFYLNRTRFVEHRKFNHEGQVKKKDKLCTICGRGFAENRTLTNHIRTHSGERPFGCSYCDAKFTQKQAMLSHVKFIHLKNKRKPAGLA